jgi:hypothetical protein
MFIVYLYYTKIPGLKQIKTLNVISGLKGKSYDEKLEELYFNHMTEP